MFGIDNRWKSKSAIRVFNSNCWKRCFAYMHIYIYMCVCMYIYMHRYLHIRRLLLFPAGMCKRKTQTKCVNRVNSTPLTHNHPWFFLLLIWILFWIFFLNFLGLFYFFEFLFCFCLFLPHKTKRKNCKAKTRTNFRTRFLLCEANVGVRNMTSKV